MERSVQVIRAPGASTFTAVEMDVSKCEAFAVTFYVESGSADATFTIEGSTGEVAGSEVWVDISAGVDLTNLTASARIDYGSGDFCGPKIRVACTDNTGATDVGAYLNRAE
jgi:hypothetical protein